MAKITSDDLYKSLGIIKDQAADTLLGMLNDKLGEKGSINIDYYQVQGEVPRYDFLEIDGNGYGHAVHIDTIEKDGDDITFNMIDEDCDGWGERDSSDFSANELVWVVEMLEETFNTIDNVYNGIVLTAGNYDYEFDEDGNAIGIAE